MGLRDPVAVYHARSNVEAHMVCNLLIQAGVEAFVTEDASVVGLWAFGTLPQIHKPQVWVDRSQLAEAGPVLVEYERQTIAQHGVGQVAADPSASVTFACEECGKSITFSAERRGYVETCPHCGELVDVPEETDPPEEPAE